MPFFVPNMESNDLGSVRSVKWRPNNIFLNFFTAKISAFGCSQQIYVKSLIPHDDLKHELPLLSFDLGRGV